MKCQFGFRKVMCRGLAKNDNKLSMSFAIANVFRVDQMIRAARANSLRKMQISPCHVY
ncbi:hypothetical protein [Marinomonas primoryensis]|uniref:hypothetical protein n=1 Tax=Marinomonas primoryensis TaxID=178399 RepID=UPI0037047DBC